ncbi:MAG: nickel-dependent hydrogenase large subunit [Epsilonproteobacteria bacterium]|nr:nickel-dependent hydrogenase large subunit [Campylobacterota bacterium]
MEKLIEKIEGEATLDFHFLDEKIDFVDIHFPHARGMERILEGRPAEDALVITPRVCGICGHAHLIAAVKALEDCYAQIEISQKAKIIRELTLNFELIQNHIKWFYLTLLPLLGYEQKILLASKATQLMSKAIALLAGQYPHNSYAIVGGVVSDPTPVELVQLENYIQETIRFFEAYMVQTDTKEMLSCEHIETMLGHKGDLPDILNELITRKWHRLGKSFDRFIVFGEDSYFKRGKSVKTRIQPHIDERYLSLSDNDRSLAKNVMYKQKYFEVGPLSRAMLLKTPLIKESHRRFSDSLFSRVLARSCESLQLLHHSLGLVKKIDLSEPSYIVPYQPISNISANGVGAVEAARGSLIHKVALEEGRIQNYQLITPTQWNLSNGDRETPGVAQKAMLGVDDIALAEFVFKTFDVCSVCTTH